MIISASTVPIFLKYWSKVRAMRSSAANVAVTISKNYYRLTLLYPVHRRPGYRVLEIRLAAAHRRIERVAPVPEAVAAITKRSS